MGQCVVGQWTPTTLLSLWAPSKVKHLDNRMGVAFAGTSSIKNQYRLKQRVENGWYIGDMNGWWRRRRMMRQFLPFLSQSIKRHSSASHSMQQCNFHKWISNATAVSQRCWIFPGKNMGKTKSIVLNEMGHMLLLYESSSARRHGTYFSLYYIQLAVHMEYKGKLDGPKEYSRERCCVQCSS